MDSKKSKGNREGVIITQRDLKILQLVFEHKVVSRDQIRNYFFGPVSKSAVNARLSKIIKMGLLKRTFFQNHLQTSSGYAITAEGLKKIKSFIPHELKTHIVNSDSTRHDITLVDIRKAFEGRSSVESYYTENILQSSSNLEEDPCLRPFIKLHSDAMAFVETHIGTLKLAIEFDSMRKSPKRYEHKLDDYYWQRDIDGVLYICSNEEILNSLHKVDHEMTKRHRCETKIYFSLLEDVIHQEGELIFRNADDDTFVVS